jgi:hypothetical protein
VETSSAGCRAPVRSDSRKRSKLYPNRSGKGYVGGRFRGNWQISIAVAASGEIQGIRSPSETLASGASAVAGFQAGPAIFITNNLPYAIRLEEGWSKQAPQGMVKVSIAEFQSIADSAIRETLA